MIVSKALVPGPQRWGGGVGPWTHGPGQKSRSRSPSQERPCRGPLEAWGSARSRSPAPLGSGTFPSRPIACTESLSDEEAHLEVRQTQGGQGRPVSPRSLTPTSPPPLPTEGQGSYPLKITE